MKKIIVIIFVCIALCGCGKKDNKYAKYEHFGSEVFNESISHTFYNNNEKSTYVVADITIQPDPNAHADAVFYKVGDDDYILLAKRDYIVEDNYNDDKTFFYQDEKNNINKLYAIRNTGNVLLEFTFNKEKITRKELAFDMSRVGKKVDTIKMVSKEFIYYGTYDELLNIKCSLTSMICEETNEEL